MSVQGNTEFDQKFKVGDVVKRGQSYTMRITNMNLGKSIFTGDRLNSGGTVIARNDTREKSSLGTWTLTSQSIEATPQGRMPLGTPARTLAQFHEFFRVGDTIKRGDNTCVIEDMKLPTAQNFRSKPSIPRGYTDWHKVDSGYWSLVAYADDTPDTSYQVGDYVTREGWLKSGYRPVRVVAIGETHVLGCREGDPLDSGEKAWVKNKNGQPLIRFEPPKGPKRAFKFVSKDGTTRNGAYTWPMPSLGEPVVVHGDQNLYPNSDRPGTHVCPEREGDGVMAALTVGAAESGGHGVRDSVGLWLEYEDEDVLGQGDGKVRLRKVTVTGVFDPNEQLRSSTSRFSQLLAELRKP